MIHDVVKQAERSIAEMSAAEALKLRDNRSRSFSVEGPAFGSSCGCFIQPKP